MKSGAVCGESANTLTFFPALVRPNRALPTVNMTPAKWRQGGGLPSTPAKVAKILAERLIVSRCFGTALSFINASEKRQSPIDVVVVVVVVVVLLLLLRLLVV